MTLEHLWATWRSEYVGGLRDGALGRLCVERHREPGAFAAECRGDPVAGQVAEGSVNEVRDCGGVGGGDTEGRGRDVRREVAVETGDLLGRERTPEDHELVDRGEVVPVTGPIRLGEAEGLAVDPGGYVGGHVHSLAALSPVEVDRALAVGPAHRNVAPPIGDSGLVDVPGSPHHVAAVHPVEGEGPGFPVVV